MCKQQRKTESECRRNQKSQRSANHLTLIRAQMEEETPPHHISNRIRAIDSGCVFLRGYPSLLLERNRHALVFSSARVINADLQRPAFTLTPNADLDGYNNMHSEVHWELALPYGYNLCYCISRERSSN